METYPLNKEERIKNGEERRKTITDLLTETSRNRYGSTSAWIFFRNFFFHPKQLKYITRGIRDPKKSTIQPIYRKKGEEVATLLAQASWVASSRSNPASKNSLDGPNQNLKIAICTPNFDKFTPFYS